MHRVPSAELSQDDYGGYDYGQFVASREAAKARPKAALSRLSCGACGQSSLSQRSPASALERCEHRSRYTFSLISLLELQLLLQVMSRDAVQLLLTIQVSAGSAFLLVTCLPNS